MPTLWIKYLIAAGELEVEKLSTLPDLQKVDELKREADAAYDAYEKAAGPEAKDKLH